MTGKKQLTLKQAEAEIAKHAPEYKLYVAAQRERKDAANDKARKTAERKMNSHRKGYTGYRNAYRAFLSLGGTRRTGKPAASKTTSAAKKNSGKGKVSKSVTTKKLSKAAMARRDSKSNPEGKTQAQLDAEPLVQDATPNAEVISQG